MTDVPHAVPAIMFEGPGVHIPSKYKNNKNPNDMVFANKPFLPFPPTPLPRFFLFFHFLSTD